MGVRTRIWFLVLAAVVLAACTGVPIRDPGHGPANDASRSCSSFGPAGDPLPASPLSVTDQVSVDLTHDSRPVNDGLLGLVWNSGSDLSALAPIHPPTVRIDASLSGEYSALMHFINDIERDKNHVFFTINALTLSGQQGGLVNLRLRMTTYLRSSSDLPAASGEEGAAGNDQASLHPQTAIPQEAR